MEICGDITLIDEMDYISRLVSYVAVKLYPYASLLGYNDDEICNYINSIYTRRITCKNYIGDVKTVIKAITDARGRRNGVHNVLFELRLLRPLLSLSPRYVRYISLRIGVNEETVKRSMKLFKQLYGVRTAKLVRKIIRLLNEVDEKKCIKISKSIAMKLTDAELEAFNLYIVNIFNGLPTYIMKYPSGITCIRNILPNSYKHLYNLNIYPDNEKVLSLIRAVVKLRDHENN